MLNLYEINPPKTSSYDVKFLIFALRNKHIIFNSYFLYLRNTIIENYIK